LRGVSFTDANTGTAVGGGGTILRTTDGGTNWTPQTSGTTNILYGVFFNDPSTGTAVGGGGTILRTINGGADWNAQTSGTTDTLRGVSFTDAINGTAVGGDGTILHTTNGGAIWTSQSSGTTEWLNSVSFTDANNGTAVGDAGTILKTTNGGTNWISQTSGTAIGLNGVSFTDSDNGTAVGYSGTILRTTNGGTTWNEQLSGTAQNLYSVSFTDTNNGTAVGQGGHILRTTNGGVPVELTSFTATANGKEVILNWSTATETNNQGFEIQRKLNNYIWNRIGFVEGHGTTTEPKVYLYVNNVNNITAASLVYRLKQLDFDGSYEYSNEVLVELSVPKEFTLEQNYPNPFNPTTTIKYSIPKTSLTKLVVYDLLGREIETLVSGVKLPDNYEVEFEASGLSTGVYFYQLQAGDYVETKKMIMLK